MFDAQQKNLQTAMNVPQGSVLGPSLFSICLQANQILKLHKIMYYKINFFETFEAKSQNVFYFMILFFFQVIRRNGQ